MVVALRGVLAAALAGSVFVQVVMVPLMAIDLKEADPDVAHLQIPFAVIMILVILTAQVTAVCVWRLVTMVREGTVFSHDAFRYVDIMIGGGGGRGPRVRARNRPRAGRRRPPGHGPARRRGAVVAAGIGLIELVLRTLLAQAISREAEAHELRAELDEVI